jgi:hypothetical protein
MAANPSFQDLFRFKNKDQQQQQLSDEMSGAECPACGKHTQPGADICESCGKWLLEEQCCFCYTPFRHGQKFCSSCGNPPAGITCKNCGTAAHFDFCPRCDTPLSKKAGPAAQALLNSPEIQLLISLRQQQQPVKPVAPDHATQLQQLSNYLKQVNAPASTTASKPAFDYTGDNKDFSREMDNSAASLQRMAEQHQVVDDTAMKQQIAALQARAFSDNQSARLYYMSIKLMLPELKLNTCNHYIGWKCNYAKVIHYAGPSDCACPSMGGHWICDGDVAWDGNNNESFTYEGVTFTIDNDPKVAKND